MKRTQILFSNHPESGAVFPVVINHVVVENISRRQCIFAVLVVADLVEDEH